jgi:transposase
MAMMHYVGLDVHRNRSSIEVLDENGKRVSGKEVLGDWDKVIAEVEALPRPLAVCYEASCGYGYLHGRLSRMSDRVEVAHPGNLRLIFKAKRKNDKVDASKLAKLLYLDAVPKVHVPSVDGRQWRGLIEFRRRLIDKRTAAKNQVRAVLRSNNLRPPKGTGLWSKKGMAWLEHLKEDTLPSMQLLQRDLLCDELEELAKKLARVEAELAKVAAKHPAVKTLMTIPGVGVRTAEAFVAYVDDAERFRRSLRAGTYFGLVPCQDSSAAKDRLGHITREGPPTVRKLLCEAAWQAVRRSPKVRAWFERITGDKPGRRKIALVAVARKLAVVMLAMMKSGQSWRESGEAGEENDASAPDQK